MSTKITVTDLFIYPIKSTRRIALTECLVENMGCQYDRMFAVLDNKNQIVTARENPNLFKIKTAINDTTLTLSVDNQEEVTVDFANVDRLKQQDALIFKDSMSSKVFDHRVNEWISNVLATPARLITLDHNRSRNMKAKYNGQENDCLRFQDASALHLFSNASVQDLNLKLKKPVTKHHFRPNVVIEGCETYAEEHWKKVKIGECEFDVAVKTGRCPMTTIDPDTIAINPQQDPLRTLAQYKKENNKVNFGIYLIPRKLGKIRVGDVLYVLG